MVQVINSSKNRTNFTVDKRQYNTYNWTGNVSTTWEGERYRVRQESLQTECRSKTRVEDQDRSEGQKPSSRTRREAGEQTITQEGDRAKTLGKGHERARGAKRERERDADTTSLT